MPEPPLRSADVFYERTAHSQLPAGIYKATDTQPATRDDTTRVQIGSNIGSNHTHKTFQPYVDSGTGNNGQAPFDYHARGWAFEVADWVPTDSRGRARIKAQTLRVTHGMDQSKTNALAPNGTVKTTIGVYKINPTTQANSLIVFGQRPDFATPNLRTIGANWGNIVMDIAFPETVFERDEVMFIQLGILGNSPQPGIGSSIHTYYLHIGRDGTSWTSRMTFLDEGPRIFFEEDGQVTAVGDRAGTASTLISLPSSSSEEGRVFRSADLSRPMNSSSVGELNIGNRIIVKSGFNLDSVAFIEQFKLITPTDLDGSGAVDAVGLAVLAKPHDADGIGNSGLLVDRQLFRSYDASANQDSSIDRLLSFDRLFGGVGDTVSELVKDLNAGRSWTVDSEVMGTIVKSSQLFRDNMGESVGAAEFDRSVLFSRLMLSDVVGDTMIQRFVIFTRSLDADAVGRFLSNDMYLRLPASGIPTPEGGTTIVKRPVYIFDD